MIPCQHAIRRELNAHGRPVGANVSNSCPRRPSRPARVRVPDHSRGRRGARETDAAGELETAYRVYADTKLKRRLELQPWIESSILSQQGGIIAPRDDHQFCRCSLCIRTLCVRYHEQEG